MYRLASVSFVVNNALTDVIASSKYGESFKDIYSRELFWSWMNGPFYEAMYNGAYSFPGRSPVNGIDGISPTFVLLDNIQIRQAKVSPMSCPTEFLYVSVGGRFADASITKENRTVCYGPFNDENKLSPKTVEDSIISYDTVNITYEKSMSPLIGKQVIIIILYHYLYL
jgi:hypothetical protein